MDQLQLWEIEADAIMNENKCSAEMVRTFVILRWMYLKGDLRPLADAILKGREIDEAVLNALALMILEDDAVPASLKDRTPYRLESKRRFGKPGRPKKPENFVRDLVIRTRVDKRIKELGPGTYDASIKDVAERTGHSERVVRNAYDRYAK
jgi:hypothetical protein